MCWITPNSNMLLTKFVSNLQFCVEATDLKEIKFRIYVAISNAYPERESDKSN